MQNRNDATVLIVDDEPSMRINLVEFLQDEGFAILEAANGTEAVRIADQQDPTVILMDIRMPETDGLRALKIIRKRNPNIPIIIFTAYGTNERPIQAMKAGAFDYLEKPFEIDELLNVINNAVHEANNLVDTSPVESEKDSKRSPQEDHIVGKSKEMKTLLKMIGKVANKDATVLLQGESGAGKEVIADAIHRHSNRANGPFIKINCGALPESLLESELFGHEAGAFTGAVSQRLGRFELADGGTIFLDEIDTLTPSMQIKLLRVLQQFTFERIGGETTLKTDARLIAATNKDLTSRIREGTFREDLFYRLNVIHLVVPPLRERKDDIEPLAAYFLKKYSPNKGVIISDDALTHLERYHWPGNVRELENVIQRAAVLARGKVIQKNDLKLSSGDISPDSPVSISENSDLSFHEVIRSVEQDLIRQALEGANWNKSKAAKKLKINRRLLYSKMDQYNIRKQQKEQ